MRNNTVRLQRFGDRPLYRSSAYHGFVRRTHRWLSSLILAMVHARLPTVSSHVHHPTIPNPNAVSSSSPPRWVKQGPRVYERVKYTRNGAWRRDARTDPTIETYVGVAWRPRTIWTSSRDRRKRNGTKERPIRGGTGACGRVERRRRWKDRKPGCAVTGRFDARERGSKLRKVEIRVVD